jgi:hypothetical protein
MKKILENDMEETNEENNKGLWSDLEQEKFKEALFLVVKNIRDIQSHVQTRSLIQVKSHCQKFFISLESKFSKDFQKIVVKNEKMKLEDFAKKWTRDYINSNFLKIVEECKDFDAEDKSGRLCSIILKGITKKNNWQFDWKYEYKQPERDVYKLSIVNNQQVVQGVVSIEIKSDHVYIHLVESAPFNKGKNKMYAGVPGNLVAFACKLSFQRGHDGNVSFFSKSQLVQHYIDSLGAHHVGGRIMIIDKISALKLINKYFPK